MINPFQGRKDLFGKPLDRDALERSLVEQPREEKPVTSARSVAIPTDIDAPENWLLLEGRSHGSYSYSDLFVCMSRLAVNPDVERAAQSLGFQVQNTATEKHGGGYIGSINWEQALSLNSALGNQTLTPRQGLDLLLDLRETASKTAPTKKLYDARGTEIPRERLKIFHNEMFRKREPWRAEWLDAKFIDHAGELHIQYGHQLVNDVLTPTHTEPLGSYMSENGYMDIKTASKFGLGTRGANNEALYFYVPSNGRVARFDADSGRAGLDCNGDPRVAGPVLGVRACREKK